MFVSTLFICLRSYIFYNVFKTLIELKTIICFEPLCAFKPDGCHVSKLWLTYLRFLLNILNRINTLRGWAQHWLTRRHTTSRPPESFRKTTPNRLQSGRVRPRRPPWRHVIVVGPDYAAHMTLAWRVHSVAKLRPQLELKCPTPPPTTVNRLDPVPDFSSTVPINGTVSISVSHERISARMPCTETRRMECSRDATLTWQTTAAPTELCWTRPRSFAPYAGVP